MLSGGEVGAVSGAVAVILGGAALAIDWWRKRRGNNAAEDARIEQARADGLAARHSGEYLEWLRKDHAEARAEIKDIRERLAKSQESQFRAEAMLQALQQQMQQEVSRLAALLEGSQKRVTELEAQVDALSRRP